MQLFSGYILKFADKNIRISTHSSELSLTFPDNYSNWILAESPTTDAAIDVAIGLPENILLFDKIINTGTTNEDLAADNFSDFQWFIAAYKGEYIYKIIHKSNPLKVIATIANYPDKKQIAINISEQLIEKGEECIHPFFYPIGDIVLVILAQMFEMVLMHGSAVEKDKRGYIFSGVSGRGKSTMANLWKQANANIINDDRLLLQKQTDGQVIAYNTPMFYAQKPKSALVQKLYLIDHAPVNLARPIQGAAKLAGAFANIIQHKTNKESASAYLKTCKNIFAPIEVANLGFLPNQTIIEYILKQN